MSELTPEARVWVAPDAYDNPTLWTDGPTPDFPRALLVRVSSNADLFDWIVGSLDALAAEKADHAETAAILRRAVAAREEAEAMHAASAQSARDFWQRVESAEARVAELEAGINAEIDHAAINGHVLDRDCQGVAPGEKVPAVRASSLRAVIEKVARRG